MVIHLKLVMSMTLFHKSTMKELRIDKTIERDFEEDSEEYRMLCNTYKDDIGFSREGKENEFDRALVEKLCEISKDAELELMCNIEETFAKCYSKGCNGYIRFAGHVINPLDFCAMRVNDFHTSFHKK